MGNLMRTGEKYFLKLVLDKLKLICFAPIKTKGRQIMIMRQMFDK